MVEMWQPATPPHKDHIIIGLWKAVWNDQNLMPKSYMNLYYLLYT